jgi:hypothetical protein
MGMATISDLVVNGVTLPTPALNGVTISREKIWSAATGRTASGKMVGTVIAQKYTLKLKWPPLTMAQAALIQQAVSGEDDFFPVKFTDAAGVTRTITCYAGTPTYAQYSWVNGIQYVVDVAVDLIEQ